MKIQLDTGTYHPDRRILERPDGEIRLTPTEGKLLEYLAARAEQVVPYLQLYQDVWGYSERVRSRTVFTTVTRLRAKIEADPEKPRHILPVPAVGYRFVPPRVEAPPELDGFGMAEDDLLAIADRLGARAHYEGGQLVVDRVHVPADLAGTLYRPGQPGDLAEMQSRLAAFLRGAWNLSTRAVAAGEIIVREGELGQEAFIIRRGTALVSRHEMGELRRLGPGDVFGELAILSGGRRTSTVVAESDVELRVVSRETLLQGLGLDSWVGGFVAALVDRFAELERRFAAR
jgi:CRP-like cAMP-binding protein/DNA-binding winged helix-turn-helix (wHTH) protein